MTSAYVCAQGLRRTSVLPHQRPGPGATIDSRVSGESALGCRRFLSLAESGIGPRSRGYLLGMKVRAVGSAAVIVATLVGCSSGSSKPLRIGSPSTSSGRTETVYSYAERVLGQSFTALPGDLAVAGVKVCVSKQAKSSKPVRISDYQLILANGDHVAPTTDAISPRLNDGPVRAGTCVRGFVGWNASSDQHPTIKDTSTGTSWKPNCPATTTSTAPCQDPALTSPTH
jgi:hypothetical protein